MAYPYEKKLQTTAVKAIEKLTQNGFSAKLLSDSFREYSVKIEVRKQEKNLGKINLYYSPKKESFTYRFNEIKDKPAVGFLTTLLEGASALSKDSSYCYNSDQTCVYVDGSYIQDKVGYGVVILQNGEVLQKLSGGIEDSNQRYMRNVAGEILAVRKAIGYCIKNKIQRIVLFYDYAGIEKWVTGEWRAKNIFTQNYAEFVRASNIQIQYHKIESHTGDRWNEYVDKLAKQGALES